MSKVRTLSLLVVSLLLLVGCESERDRLMRDKYPAYPGNIKHAIDHDYVIQGMDQEQVYLAIGNPICKKTITYQHRHVEVWAYPPGGDDPCSTAEYRVYFENGVVTEWKEFR